MRRWREEEEEGGGRESGGGREEEEEEEEMVAVVVLLVLLALRHEYIFRGYCRPLLALACLFIRFNFKQNSGSKGDSVL